MNQKCRSKFVYQYTKWSIMTPKNKSTWNLQIEDQPCLERSLSLLLCYGSIEAYKVLLTLIKKNSLCWRQYSDLYFDKISLNLQNKVFLET